jgi:glycosyltransferase involved in cell wall biosynthesis
MSKIFSYNGADQSVKLSVYIITFNEADKITAALQSVVWADEVLVLDSKNTDDTVKIAVEMGATVMQIPFTTFGKLRNDAIAACQHDWVFSLDVDEHCTPAVRVEILQVLAQPHADAYFRATP